MHTPTSALAATTALMVTALKRTAALTPALLLVLTGCVGPFVPPPGPVPSVSGPAPVPSSAPACTAPESTVAPDAKYLVGEWICTGSTTEMRFRFSADGEYASRESLEYNIPLGRFVFHRDKRVRTRLPAIGSNSLRPAPPGPARCRRTRATTTSTSPKS